MHLASRVVPHMSQSKLRRLFTRKLWQASNLGRYQKAVERSEAAEVELVPRNARCAAIRRSQVGKAFFGAWCRYCVLRLAPRDVPALNTSSPRDTLFEVVQCL